MLTLGAIIYRTYYYHAPTHYYYHPSHYYHYPHFYSSYSATSANPLILAGSFFAFMLAFLTILALMRAATSFFFMSPLQTTEYTYPMDISDEDMIIEEIHYF